MVNYQLNGYDDVAPMIDHVMRGARRDASDEEQFVLDAIHEGMLQYHEGADSIYEDYEDMWDCNWYEGRTDGDCGATGVDGCRKCARGASMDENYFCLECRRGEPNRVCSKYPDGNFFYRVRSCE